MESKKRKAPEPSILDPIDTCIQKAEKEGHEFIVKRGNNLRSYPDAEAFFNSYLDNQSRTDCYELVHEGLDRKFYLKLDFSQEEEPDEQLIQNMVEIVVQLVRELVIMSDVPLAVFKECRPVYEDGENKYKISLMIIFTILICPAGKSMIRLVQRVIEAAENDDEAAKLLFEDGACIVDTQIYSPKQFIRLPFSIKKGVPLKYVETKKNEMDDDDDFTIFQAGCITVIESGSKVYDIPSQYLEVPLVNKKSKKVKVVDQKVNESIKKKQGIIKILYRIMEETFPKGREECTIETTDKPNMFKITPGEEGRYCPIGKGICKDELAFFFVYREQILYICRHDECIDKSPIVITKQKCENSDVGDLESMDQKDLDRYLELNDAIFKTIDDYYMREASELGLKHQKPIGNIPQSDIRLLHHRWKRDIHFVINKFTARINDDSKIFMVSLYHRYNQHGYLRRHVERLTLEMAKNKFADFKITIPELVEKSYKVKGETHTEIRWHAKPTTLGKYLVNSEKGMRASEKVTYSGIEFYPLLGEEDKRTPQEKGNKINTFSGLEITKQEAKAWWDSLPADKQTEHQTYINFVRDHQLHVIAAGNQKDYEYYEKYQSYILQNPHQKLDTSIVILGEQGVGKSKMTEVLKKIYGQHLLVIRKIDQLNEQFNAHLEKALMIVVEECSSPNDHKLVSYLKSLVDNNDQMTFNEKNLPKWVGKLFANFLFISNEDHGQYVGYKERRWYFLKTKDSWISKVCAANNWNHETEYMEYMDKIEPRAWVYHLCYQVDISDFNPRRDRHRTHETVNQIIKTLPKDSPIKYFWYSLLSPASINSKGMNYEWDFRIHEHTIEQVKRLLTVAVDEEWVSGNIDQFLGMEDVSENTNLFRETINQLHEIKTESEEKGEHNPADLNKRLAKCTFDVDGKISDPTIENDIFNYMKENKKLEVAKFMYYHDGGFIYEDLYKNKFLFTIYQENNNKLLPWQKVKCPQTSFITETKAIFGQVLTVRRSTKKRSLRNYMGTLFEMRKAYEKHVFRIEGFFEHEIVNSSWEF